ncbi:hypothetical protein B0H14DRAFT_3165675 [Mycena olivaceomarginata]|nr:hypothetical protein B0H14DRAFT_3165675 [Mycena olivaceomarginata]
MALDAVCAGHASRENIGRRTGFSRFSSIVQRLSQKEIEAEAELMMALAEAERQADEDEDTQPDDGAVEIPSEEEREIGWGSVRKIRLKALNEALSLRLNPY